MIVQYESINKDLEERIMQKNEKAKRGKKTYRER